MRKRKPIEGRIYQEFNGRRFMWNGRYYSSGDKRMHVFVWETINGPIPDGHCIHHKDQDRHNNDIGNLQLMLAEDHAKLHMSDPIRRSKAAKAIQSPACAAAARAWHKSEDGRAWHREHGKKAWQNRQPNDYVCAKCGNSFQSIKVARPGSLYCSHACQAAARRKSGVDDIPATCKGCGIMFNTNKYHPRKYHSRECRFTTCRA